MALEVDAPEDWDERHLAAVAVVVAAEEWPVLGLGEGSQVPRKPAQPHTQFVVLEDVLVEVLVQPEEPGDALRDVLQDEPPDVLLDVLLDVRGEGRDAEVFHAVLPCREA